MIKEEKEYSPLKVFYKVYKDEHGVESKTRVLIDLEDVSELEEYIDEAFTQVGDGNITLVKTYQGEVILLMASFNAMVKMIRKARKYSVLNNLSFKSN